MQPFTNINSNFVTELNNMFFVVYIYIYIYIYISDGGDNFMYPQRSIYFKI
jgi:hypothetical protein